MKIYQRYLLKPYFYFLCLIFPVFVGIYNLVEFFDKLDNITHAKLPWYSLFEYLFYRLPEIIFDLWPICLALGGLLSFVFLARGGELLAFRSLGFSAKKLAFPYIVAAFLLSLAFVVTSDFFLPQAAYKARFFWETKVLKKDPKGVIIKGKLHFRGVDSFLIAQVLTSSVNYLRDVTYAKIDNKGLPIRIIWAKEAFYRKGLWHFKNGIIKERADKFAPKWFKEYSMRLEFDPDTVLTVKKTPRLHQLYELWQQRQFLKQAGLPYTLTESEIAYRLCWPLLTVPLLIFSLPALIGQRGRHALGKGLTLSVIFLMLGLLFFLVMKHLGDKGIASPLLVQPLSLLVISLAGFVNFRVFRV
ncbi:MAG: LptF/LptG family permease [Desulfonauticus sp.]|nr:LptF/LptG family permease [Desulfonauticus sp.]